MKPLAYVVLELLVIGWALVDHIRRDPSAHVPASVGRGLGGVIGLDVWYLHGYACPAGFSV